jgi:hypothetical protein
MLKERQNKLKFERNNQINKYMAPWMNDRIQPDEFIYFVYKLKGKENFYAVTDKKFVKNMDKKYIEAPLSEVTSINNATVKKSFLSISTFFIVNTLKGQIVFDGFSVGEAANCGTLIATMRKALANHNSREKDERAIIISLNLD